MNTPINPIHDAIRTNYEAIARHIRSKVPEPDCYDLTQECVVALVRKPPEEVESPRAYLWGIVSNKIKQYYAHQTRNRFIASLVDYEVLPVATLSTRLSTKLARRNDIEAALQALPLREQQAFELRHVEGLTHEECARALGCSVATVKRREAAARGRLATHLGRTLDDAAELEQLIAAYLGRRH